MQPSTLMIIQGGGPTTVFNRTLAAAIAEAQVGSVARILGARHGVQGLVQGDFVDLSGLSEDHLSLLRQTPGAALGTSRYSPTEQDMSALVSHVRDLNVRMLLFMGGNGTMRGAHLVREHCRANNLDICVVGAPKTIDNDLSSTDRAPGYASAARYIASATRELGADIRSLPQPVTILETLGRNVGWIAAASLFARSDLQNPSDCPHLIYIPEVPFIEEEFLQRLSDRVQRFGWALVVAAEGIRKPDGSLVYQLADPGQADPLKRPMTGGVAQYLAGLVSNRLRIRCRSEKPGLLGRGSMAHISQQDIKDAESVGRAGVRALLEGADDVMVSLPPLSPGNPTMTTLVPLDQASQGERPIPSDWLSNGPVPVNDKFIRYVRPLVGELDRHIERLGSPLVLQQEIS